MWKDWNFLGTVLLVIVALGALYWYTSAPSYSSDVPTGNQTEEFSLGEENAPLMDESAEPASETPDKRDQLSAQDLLPKDESSAWAQVNPCGSGSLKNMNFLQAGHHIGISTVGSSLKNPNYQLRSEPLNPQNVVSPWLQSTYSGDTLRRPLEIGSC